MSSFKGYEDLVSDSVDAFCAGQEDLAGQYLKDAIELKVQERFCECLKDKYVKISSS